MPQLSDLGTTSLPYTSTPTSTAGNLSDLGNPTSSATTVPTSPANTTNTGRNITPNQIGYSISLEAPEDMKNWIASSMGIFSLASQSIDYRAYTKAKEAWSKAALEKFTSEDFGTDSGNIHNVGVNLGGYNIALHGGIENQVYTPGNAIPDSNVVYGEAAAPQIDIGPAIRTLKSMGFVPPKDLQIPLEKWALQTIRDNKITPDQFYDASISQLKSEVSEDKGGMLEQFLDGFATPIGGIAGVLSFGATVLGPTGGLIGQGSTVGLTESGGIGTIAGGVGTEFGTGAITAGTVAEVGGLVLNATGGTDTESQVDSGDLQTDDNANMDNTQAGDISGTDVLAGTDVLTDIDIDGGEISDDVFGEDGAEVGDVEDDGIDGEVAGTAGLLFTDFINWLNSEDGAEWLAGTGNAIGGFLNMEAWNEFYDFAQGLATGEGLEDNPFYDALIHFTDSVPFQNLMNYKDDPFYKLAYDFATDTGLPDRYQSVLDYVTEANNRYGAAHLGGTQTQSGATANIAAEAVTRTYATMWNEDLRTLLQGAEIGIGAREKAAGDYLSAMGGGFASVNNLQGTALSAMGDALSGSTEATSDIIGGAVEAIPGTLDWLNDAWDAFNTAWNA